MKGRNTGTIIGLVCGFIVAGSTATMGITDMKQKLQETKKEVQLYKELNERQQDIILEYKVVSGIEVSSITKTLDNKELIKQLDEKIKKLEEK
ncbi:sodium/glutamate symporter [Enterococcus phage SSMH02]|nr:sodium/glutamate symporter [Enterococcus phage SSMH02]WNO24261.1 symporter protein [Enterococcus phage SSMH01]